MKKIILIFVIILLIVSCKTDKEADKKSEALTKAKFEYPPEWEPHQAVWIDFHDDSHWAVSDSEARLEIIKELSKSITTKVLLDGDIAEKKLDSLIKRDSVDMTNIIKVQHPLPNTAMRDAGPIFLSNGSDFMIADFLWNGYGGKHADDLERGQIANDLAKRFGWNIQSSDFAAEGGGLEVNYNVILSTKHHGLSRNPEKSLEEIETEYLKMYNKSKVIWIEQSTLIDKPGRKIANYFGQGADQHIDAVMRFVNDSTILVPVMDSSEKNNTTLQTHDYEALQKNLAQIKKETNSNGRSFNIVEIPFPDVSLYIFKGKVFPGLIERYPNENLVLEDEVNWVPVMSYANFLITNDAVLVSEYWKEGLPEKEKIKDQKMKEILAKYFPNREIIGIKNALLLNWNGGGIHCQTQQEPKIN